MENKIVIPLDYESQEDYRNACIACLMVYLCGYPPFVEDLAKLKQYPLVLGRELGVIRSMAKAKTQRITDPEEYEQANGYLRTIEEIVKKYRLNPA